MHIFLRHAGFCLLINWQFPVFDLQVFLRIGTAIRAGRRSPVFPENADLLRIVTVDTYITAKPNQLLTTTASFLEQTCNLLSSLAGITHLNYLLIVMAIVKVKIYYQLK